MLSEKAENFILQSMKIDLQSIIEKLDEEGVATHRSEIEGAIEKFIHAILGQNSSTWQHEKRLFDDSPAEGTINQYATDLMDKFSNEEAKVVLDSLRHAFCSYAYGNLHQLFTRQVNENWYPKVILDEVLEPNDIDALPDIVSLYRGTDSQEFESQKYGQSWTTNKQIAHDFAFVHYQGQQWFEGAKRLILCADISKQHVYFSNQTCEFEVVVNTSKLVNVRVCT